MPEEQLVQNGNGQAMWGQIKQREEVKRGEVDWAEVAKDMMNQPINYKFQAMPLGRVEIFDPIDVQQNRKANVEEINLFFPEEDQEEVVLEDREFPKIGKVEDNLPKQIKEIHYGINYQNGGRIVLSPKDDGRNIKDLRLNKVLLEDVFKAIEEISDGAIMFVKSYLK